MTYQDTKEAPCTILEGPWSIGTDYINDDNAPHCVIGWIYGGRQVVYIKGEAWSYGNRWQDPTLFEELAEMIRQAPEVRKERDELKAALERGQWACMDCGYSGDSFIDIVDDTPNGREYDCKCGECGSVNTGGTSEALRTLANELDSARSEIEELKEKLISYQTAQ